MIMKRKILRYGGIFLIIVGIAVLIYPFYTNFILKRREAAILASWDEEVSTEQEYQESITEEEYELQKETLLVDPTKKIPFKITIPELGVEWIVNEGTDYVTLREGPGHYTSSALPGEVGKCVIAGHRTTYGAPFNRVDELEEGDEILIETLGNEDFTYIVTDNFEVIPTDMSVLETTDYPSLILSTCTPKYFATRRLIIFAEIPGYIPEEE